ncbi:MAG: hypothetical protein JXQ87_13845 [Bacteroidia bacterium]
MRYTGLFYLFCLSISMFSCDQPDDPIEEKFDWRKALISSEKPLSEANEPDCFGPPLVDFEMSQDPELLRLAHFNNIGFIASVRVSQKRPELVAYRCYYPLYTDENSFNGFEVINYLKNLITNNRIEIGNYSWLCNNQLVFHDTNGLNILNCDDFSVKSLGANLGSESLSPSGKILSYYNYSTKEWLIKNLESDKLDKHFEPIHFWLSDSSYVTTRRGNIYLSIDFYNKDSTLLSRNGFLARTDIYDLSPNKKLLSNGNLLLDITSDQNIYLPSEKEHEQSWCWNKGLWNFSFLPDNTIISGKYLYYPNYNTMEAKLTYQMRLISGPDYQTETYIELNLETERL